MELREDNYNSIWNCFYNYYQEQLKSMAGKTGFNFNILSEQCGNIVENSHTNILMRILQYRNRYGYAFLEDFISLAGFDISIAAEEVMFCTEYQGKTVGQGRIDGLIWQKDNFAIIIENKINHAGNEDRQVARYVETVLNDRIAGKDNIFVVFLTRDGIEVPDNDSKLYLKDCGICEVIDDKEVSGPRYFACSFSEHIYNWLRDSVQPMIPQKDVVMNAGVIQYVDYLDGMLGYKAESYTMLQVCGKWFDENVQIVGDVAKQNDSLYKFYQKLPADKPANKPTNISPEAKLKSDCTNMLKNVIDRKNEQLMSLLLTATKDYFTSGQIPAIKEYHLNHHFTYYYITIRDKKWPQGFNFGWYPLGMKRLCKEKQLTLSFNFNRKQLDRTLEHEINGLGFCYNEKSRTYKKEITVSESDPFLYMTEEAKRKFLESTYKKYVIPVIEKVIPDGCAG